MAFQDHYSAYATDYARHRPAYPPGLFAFLASQTTGRDLAWDAGTGNGQAAIGLAAHFAAVRATDPSGQQLAEAPPHPRVTYRLGDEGASGLPAGSCDLITAAQAAHWFDLDRFAGEARRVARAGAVVAIWGYGLCTVDPEVDTIIGRFYADVVGPYWPPERRHVDQAYRSLAFPATDIPFPDLAMEARLDLPGLAAYLGTWSAVHRMRQVKGGDPVAPLLDELARCWGAPSEVRPVRWPLFGRIGMVGHRRPPSTG